MVEPYMNKIAMQIGGSKVTVSFLQNKGYTLYQIDKMVNEGYLEYIDGKKYVIKTEKCKREIF